MIDNTISFNSILVSFEGALKIEMTGDQKVSSIIEQAVERLENTYSCKFDKSIFDLQAENQLLAESVNILLRDIEQCLAQMSLYLCLKVYHKNLPITLSDVNYLGYAKEELLRNLQYLIDESQSIQYSEDIARSLYNTLNNIPMCSVKRMFIILLMFERLGVAEGMSIMAQVIYLGGLI